MDDFAGFFKRATGHPPYAYQERLAAERAIPDILDLPTGSGKTEAAVLSVWLWGRRNDHRETPRRLAYCLPRRSLVEQTVVRVRRWVKNLGLEHRIGVSQIMGGDSQWSVESEPEREHILVGTQDMLLSGALNRQYGKGFKAWPMHFALLNNDCLWVMDEIQLMENGLPTSRQLDAFRRKMGTYGPHHTVWMSATINKQWLKTPDSVDPQNIFRLTGAETGEGMLGRRNAANKTVRQAGITVDKKYGDGTVRRLLGMHCAGTPTIIMVNTVRRAQNIHAVLKNAGAPCMLVHSRFRPAERRGINERISRIRKDENIIIVSTQVLEAGVDISARTLVTELAPWPSMVQRFGRCNRGAEYDQADIVWLDIDDEALMGPYDKSGIDHARGLMSSMEGRSAAPMHLPGSDTDMAFDSVLRRRDIVELFDTAQDLSGGRTDASRFVRTSQRPLDVDIFWRGADTESPPHAGEVCSIPVSDARRLIREKGGRVFDYAADRWVDVRDALPGQTIMLDGAAGGYSPETGWQAELTDAVEAVARPTRVPEGIVRRPVTLGGHTAHVVTEAERLVGQLGVFGNEQAGAVTDAARHHDVGKAHPVFKETMTRGGCPDDGNVWAKSAGSAKHSRPGFRHEAASALAYLAHCPDSNLAAYLIAAHHGIMRLSMRSVHPDDRHILGLLESDRLPAYDDGTVSMPETVLNAVLMAGLGRRDGPSWAGMAARLLDEYGPFRLAYLEMVVRAADWVASRKENDDEYREAAP